MICVIFSFSLRIKSCPKHSKSGESPRFHYLELCSFYPLYHPILRLSEVRSSLTKFNKIHMKYFLLILSTALIASTSIFLGCSNSSNSYRNESSTSYSQKSSRMNSNYKKKSYSRSYYWMKYFFLSVSLLYMALPAILVATVIVGPA